jgi:hypothetical protein
VALRADANTLGFNYGAETLPKGAPEFYPIFTSRTGNAAGDDSALDLQRLGRGGLFRARLQALQRATITSPDPLFKIGRAMPIVRDPHGMAQRVDVWEIRATFPPHPVLP